MEELKTLPLNYNLILQQYYLVLSPGIENNETILVYTLCVNSAETNITQFS